jgi:uncharacterized protein (DUF433 family)
MAASAPVLEVATQHSPIYLVSDVARFVRLPYQTAYSWVKLIPGRQPELPPSAGLNFLDLISILVIGKLEDIGVNPRRIRRAEKFLLDRYGPYPFSQRVIWTDGKHVFFAPDSPLREEVPEKFLISANSGGQQAFVHLLQQYLQRVEYGKQGLAIRWTPTNKVELDPSRQFGQPCVRNTRVLTESIYSLHVAGDTEQTIIRAYDLSREEVRAALAWEKSLRKAA